MIGDKNLYLVLDGQNNLTQTISNSQNSMNSQISTENNLKNTSNT